MARKLTISTIKSRTKKRLQSLGIYRPEFDDLIEIYADSYLKYTVLSQKIDMESDAISESAAGTAKKNPMITEMENLRKDLLNYSDRLCLNPASYQKLAAPQQADQEGKLADIIKKLGE